MRTSFFVSCGSMSKQLFEPVDSPYLVPFDESFKIHKAATSPPDDCPSKKENAEALDATVAKLAKLQGKLYADDRYAVLLVFQAMDAAGKAGRIRAVISGLTPRGCQSTRSSRRRPRSSITISCGGSS